LDLSRAPLQLPLLLLLRVDARRPMRLGRRQQLLYQLQLVVLLELAPLLLLRSLLLLLLRVDL